MAGRVYLVGAGPGDPGLLTLRGRECLREADLVLYDGLVNPLLLAHARADCERAGRTDDRGRRRVDQAAINERLVEAGLAGRTVVRLKGGDPFIFGRGSEEADALREAGVPFEVVPGVTAATAAGGYAGFPLTHRGTSSAVALITGHEDPAKGASDLDYAALAAFPGTLVFYMGLHRLPRIAAALLEAGKPAGTPAAVVSRASTVRQRTVVSTLAGLPEEVDAAGLRPPSLIVVGECVRQRERLAWFEVRPLFGVSIAVPRPAEQAADVVAQTLARGAEPVLVPTIGIGPPDSWDGLDSAVWSIDGFTHLAFTSANAVGPFFERLAAAGLDARALGGLRTACVGPSTAAALGERGLLCDVLPGESNAEALAAAILADGPRPSVLWPRSDRGRDALPSAIESAGGRVEAPVAYSNREAGPWPAEAVARLREGVDWVAMTSPSVARAVAARWPDDAPRPRAVAVSGLTAEAAAEAGWPCERVAASPEWAGVLDAVGDAGDP